MPTVFDKTTTTMPSPSQIYLPAGIDDIDSILLIGIVESDDSFSKIDLTLPQYGGFTVVNAGGYNYTSPRSASCTWFYRVIDGTEGWAGDGNDLILVNDYTKDPEWHLFAVALCIRDAGIPESESAYNYWFGGDGSNLLTPPPLTPTWDPSNSSVLITSAFGRPPSIDYVDGTPAGFTVLCDYEPTDLPSGDVPLIAHYLEQATSPAAAPAPYSGTPAWSAGSWDGGAFTILVPPRFPVTPPAPDPTCEDIDGLGDLPPGAGWDGDTPWVKDDGAGGFIPTEMWQEQDGLAVFAPTTDDGEVAYQRGSEYDGSGIKQTDVPDGPHNWAHVARVKVEFKKGAGTGGFRFVGYRWQGSQWEGANIGGAVRLGPGDDTHGPNAWLQVENFGASDQHDFDAPIWDDGQYWLVVDFTNGLVRAKAWKVGEQEPPSLQTSIVTGIGADVSSIGLIGQGLAGDVIEVDTIEIGGEPPPHRAINNVLVGLGTDDTTWYEMPSDFLPGSAVVRVDGLVVLPVAWWLDNDPPAFTLDRAPQQGARVTVSYLTA